MASKEIWQFGQVETKLVETSSVLTLKQGSSSVVTHKSNLRLPSQFFTHFRHKRREFWVTNKQGN